MKLNPPTPRQPLRLWPGVAAVTLMCLLRFGVLAVSSGDMAGYIALFGELFGVLAVVGWWLFFSRAPWSERLGAVALMIVALAATPRILDQSIATGMMGAMFAVYALPVLCVAFVAWAVATRRLPDGLRRASMAVTILLACGVFALLRTDGVTGDGLAEFSWRWSETAEQRLVAQARDTPLDSPRGGPLDLARGKQATLPEAPAAPKIEPSAPPAAETAVGAATSERGFTRAEWPGFRGSKRDGVVAGVRIETNWAQSPPVQLWRRPIGPGWSSFAVRGNLLYTQEQRGDDEVVACYNLTTGEPVWKHRDAARFWESHAGAGPRATPTLHNGRVYTFGPTGILNSLDADHGAVVWSRNVASDTGTKVPTWGFASSPVVVDDVVIVAAAGKLVAYGLATGDRRWVGQDGGEGYSSPHVSTIGGVAQVVLLSEAGATSVAPRDGTPLWEHAWKQGMRIVQPALTQAGDVLIGAGDGQGLRRVAIAHGAGGWTVEERWTSAGLKPHFNDFVVHEAHAYGFDGSILSSVDVEHGTRKWKGGRYGHGQLVVLPDQDLLLVLSEEGEVALVRAVPDQFTELGRFTAIEGKTWNHPVLVGDTLLVRNGQEMAAFRLSLASR
jgi:outer membrane protein assembly factor BamB